MRGLSQHKSADLVTAPTVVTKSAQKARIEVVRELIYPVEFDPPELPQEVSVGVGAGIFPVTPAHPTTFEMRPTGVTLEVDPQVGPDSYTIDLSLAPEVVEFGVGATFGEDVVEFDGVSFAETSDVALGNLVDRTEVFLQES